MGAALHVNARPQGNTQMLQVNLDTSELNKLINNNYDTHNYMDATNNGSIVIKLSTDDVILNESGHRWIDGGWDPVSYNINNRVLNISLGANTYEILKVTHNKNDNVKMIKIDKDVNRDISVELGLADGYTYTQYSLYGGATSDNATRLYFEDYGVDRFLVEGETYDGTYVNITDASNKITLYPGFYYLRRGNPVEYQDAYIRITYTDGSTMDVVFSPDYGYNSGNGPEFEWTSNMVHASLHWIDGNTYDNFFLQAPVQSNAADNSKVYIDDTEVSIIGGKASIPFNNATDFYHGKVIKIEYDDGTYQGDLYYILAVAPMYNDVIIGQSHQRAGHSYHYVRDNILNIDCIYANQQDSYYIFDNPDADPRYIKYESTGTIYTQMDYYRKNVIFIKEGMGVKLTHGILESFNYAYNENNFFTLNDTTNITSGEVIYPVEGDYITIGDLIRAYVYIIPNTPVKPTYTLLELSQQIQGNPLYITGNLPGAHYKDALRDNHTKRNIMTELYNTYAPMELINNVSQRRACVNVGLYEYYGNAVIKGHNIQVWNTIAQTMFIRAEKQADGSYSTSSMYYRYIKFTTIDGSPGTPMVGLLLTEGQTLNISGTEGSIIESSGVVVNGTEVTGEDYYLDGLRIEATGAGYCIVTIKHGYYLYNYRITYISQATYDEFMKLPTVEEVLNPN